ncbi:MAG: hypothetical protein K6E98_09595 [Lachnospiraceae bacterium]|nr:hypothetical protein [Lachnospiraceae bacterium]
MKKTRLKILTDKMFHKLWMTADVYTDEDEFIKDMAASVKIFKFESIGLDLDDYIYMLRNIYKARKMTFKEIADRSEVKKSELSHTFCIPIRTVEDWYCGKNKTPTYINLMLIKYYHLLDLGKYTRLESDLNYIKTKPNIYAKNAKANKEVDVPKKDKSRSDNINKNIENNKDKDKEMGTANTISNIYEGHRRSAQDYYDEYISSEDYESYLDKLIMDAKRRKKS